MQRIESGIVLIDYDPKSGVMQWLTFPRRTKSEHARAVFADVYGYPPLAVQRRWTLLLVGPILNGKEEAK